MKISPTSCFSRSCLPAWSPLVLGALLLGMACTFAADEPKVFDVRARGARGDGRTVDTAAIQQALDECGQAGGGIVRFPAGDYLSQPIHLRSRTTLQLDAGATLRATTNRADFLRPDRRGEPTSLSSFLAFVNGRDLTEVTIQGQGKIDGSGEAWWGPAREAKRNPTNSGYTLPRPRLVVLTGCQKVRIAGVTLENSPSFHLVPAECEDVVIEGVTIRAPDDAPNTDAIDPSMSRRVRITRCWLDVGDDNIAIKSGRRVPGREFACEDITIMDCTFVHGHGLSIGSETAGGVRHVRAERLTLLGTENGLRIKSPRGKGGTVEDIVYRDITLSNCHPGIVFTAYYPKIPAQDTAQPMTPETPVFRNIRIENVTATCPKEAGIIVGLPESAVADVVLENVVITARTGLTLRNAKGVKLKNVKVNTQQGPPFLLENAEVEGLPK